MKHWCTVASRYAASPFFSLLKFSSNLSQQVLERADFTIPVEIEGQYHNIYVIKRPGVDQFMKRVGELYEVVVFTASVSKVSLTIHWHCIGWIGANQVSSMVILCWINWTFIMLSTTGCSGTVATITKGTMSRSVLSWTYQDSL